MLKLKQLQQKQQQQQQAAEQPAAPAADAQQPAADGQQATGADGQPASGESYVLKKQNSKDLAEVRQEKTRQGVLSLKAKGKRTGGKAKQNAAELRAQKGPCTFHRAIQCQIVSFFVGYEFPEFCEILFILRRVSP
jgi:ubiquitin-conjugating enzyme E2 M